MNRYLIRICLIAATGGFLFGFDTSVISGVIEYISVPKVYDLSHIGKGWTVSCIIVGCMLGCVVAGPLSSRFGRKWALIGTALVFLASALGCAFAGSYDFFVVSRIISGVAVGAASMLAPIYIAEISPASHRGKLVSLNLFAIFLGQSSAFYSNYLLRGVGGDDNWRWMIGIMAVPAFLLFVALLFVPESPRWLVGKQRESDALAVLTRVNGADASTLIMEEIREAIHAEDQGRLSELFHAGMRRLLAIGCLLAIFQQVTGINAIMYYAPSIFRSAGFGEDSALMQTALMGTVNLSFAVISMFFVDRLGRRPLMMLGSVGMTIAMGFLALTFLTGRVRGHLVLFCIMGYLAAFGLSLGPVVWVLIAEIFPNRVRSYAVAVATFALWAANFVVSLSFPYLLATLRGYSFLIYGGMCMLCLAFVVRYLRETKGLTLEQVQADLCRTNPAPRRLSCADQRA